MAQNEVLKELSTLHYRQRYEIFSRNCNVPRKGRGSLYNDCSRLCTVLNSDRQALPSHNAYPFFTVHPIALARGGFKPS